MNPTPASRPRLMDDIHDGIDFAEAQRAEARAAPPADELTTAIAKLREARAYADACETLACESGYQNAPLVFLSYEAQSAAIKAREEVGEIIDRLTRPA